MIVYYILVRASTKYTSHDLELAPNQLCLHSLDPAQLPPLDTPCGLIGQLCRASHDQIPFDRGHGLIP